MVQRAYTLESFGEERGEMIYPTAYWAPLDYYQSLLHDDNAQIEQYESFPKRTFRNRAVCRDIKGNEIILTVPVQKVNSKQLTRDVKISYQTNWQHQHWNTIQSLYRHYPYFVYYEDYIRPLYSKQYVFLTDLNDELTNIIIQLLQNRLPNQPLQLKRTTEWNRITDWQWSNEDSIMPRLFALGPQTI